MSQTTEKPAELGQKGEVSLSAGLPVSLSPMRAWFYLVWLSLQRQARARQMVWIALGLLVLSTVMVVVQSTNGWWNIGPRRYPNRWNPTLQQWLSSVAATGETSAALWNAPAGAFHEAFRAAVQEAINQSGFPIFSRWIVFGYFLSFLLPIWSLSFATEALGGDREGNNLIWLLTRPLPRPAIYLAKFVALLPWSLALGMGGFGVLCLAAGRIGATAFALYWPAVLCATLAFSALFHVMSACFRRSAIVAIVYSLFLETILGNMPGYLKRVSIGFYTRCMMFDAAADYGMQPEKPTVFLPVDGTTALAVLLSATLGLLVLGMVVFSRSEYQDLT